MSGDEGAVGPVMDGQPTWLVTTHGGVVIRRSTVVNEKVKFRMRVHAAGEVASVARKRIRVRVRLRRDVESLINGLVGSLKRW